MTRALRTFAAGVFLASSTLLGASCLDLVGEYRHGNHDALAVSGKHLYLGSGATIVAIDVQDPLTPAPLGEFPLNDHVYGLRVVGSLLHAAGDFGLRILDVSSPGSPTVLGSLSSFQARDVDVLGSYAYLAAAGAGLKIVDISNPAFPSVVGTRDTPGFAQGVLVEGGYAYLADGSSGLTIVNVGDPVNPVLAGGLDTSYAYGLGKSGPVVFVADGSSFKSIDVSDPSAPSLVSTLNIFPPSAYSVYIEGTLAMVTESFGQRLIDITNPAFPQQLSSRQGSRSWEGVLVGSLGYVASDAGLEILSLLDPANPWLLGYYLLPAGYANGVAATGNLALLGGAPGAVLDVTTPGTPIAVSATGFGAWDVEASGSLAHLADWNRFRIVDVTDPAIPVWIGAATIPTNYHRQRLALGTNLAAVAEESTGMWLIDTSEPSAPLLLASVPFGTANDVALGNGLAAVSDGLQGVRMVDLTIPASPAVVGTLPPPSYSTAVEFLSATHLAAGDYNTGLITIDISDATAPTIAKTVPTPRIVVSLVHTGSLLIANEEETVEAFDVSNPANPRPLGLWQMTTDRATDAAMASGHVYLSRLDTGLAILDVTGCATVIFYDGFEVGSTARWAPLAP